MNHFIEKETVLLHSTSLSGARRWELSIHDMLERVINPAIENCFDKLSTTQRDTIVDKITIDLGRIDNASDQEIIGRISDQLMQNQAFRFSADGMDVLYSSNVLPLPDEVAAGNGELNDLDRFIYYLIEGKMPWWFRKDNPGFDAAWIRELGEYEVESIRKKISGRSQAIKRLVIVFEQNFLVEFLRKVDAAKTETLTARWEVIKKAVRGLSNQDSLRRIYWIEGVSWCFGGKFERYNILRIVTDSIDTTVSDLRLVLKYLLPILKDHHQSTRQMPALMAEKTPELWVQALLVDCLRSFELSKVGEMTLSPEEKSQLLFWKGVLSENNDDDQVLDEAEESGGLSTERRDSDPDDELPSKDMEEEPRAEETADAIYVEAAGLVILHPFLKELFKMANLWSNENTWTTDNGQESAVRLLTWLAYGTTDIPEYRLALPKLLCGMQVNEPVESGIALSQDSVNACVELLKAVIDHWKALGKTSIDGLRDGFILRDGKVARKGDDWSIVIERKTQDILLNRLPWAISLIYLPWCKKSKFYVEWT